MHELESELHQVLLDLAPDTHEEEQARIVAEASSIYSSLSKSWKREAEVRVHEARLADALLQAMGQLDDWDYDAPQYIDGQGLSAEQIVQQASRNFGGRYAASFDTIDDDIQAFLTPPSQDADNYLIDDGEDVHPPDRYQIPGRGTHRSDSLSR